MKHVTAVVLVLIFLFVGCGAAEVSQSSYALASTYNDIPYVTDEEIEAIEALRASGRELVYGLLESSEAFVSGNGELDGFAVMFTELLYELFGMRFNIQLYGWDELISMLEDGEVDFTGELTPTEARQAPKADGGKGYIMSAPIAARMLRVFTTTDSIINTESDLTGLRIGFLEGTTTPGDIRSTYHTEFEGVEVTVPEGADDGVDEYDIAIQMIISGEIDAFVEEATADPAFDKYNADEVLIRSAVMFPLIHAPVSMTTVNPELWAVISVLDKYMAAGGLNKLDDMYLEGEFRYTRHKLESILTPEEKEFISDFARRGEAVPVGFEHDNYPLSFYNKTEGRFEGIAVDVLDDVGKLTGLNFMPAVSKDATWSEIYEKLVSGEVHMVAQLIYSDSRRDNFLWTKPYAHSYYALLSRTDYPNLSPHQVTRTRVGVTKGSGKKDVYYELFPNNPDCIEFNTQNDCLDGLERGDVDLLIASEYMLLTQQNFREKSGLKINIKLDVPLNSQFGFTGDRAVLRSVIDKAIQFVDTDFIETSWTGRQFDYSKKIAEERTFYMTLFLAAMSFVLAATVFLLIRDIKLRKKMTEIANNDALTGIYNRRFFMELAGAQATRSERTGINCFVIIFDLDHFKAVNDTYGHLAGDKVLHDVAQRVKNTIRPYDILGRYGGEEFIILMTDVKEIDREHAMNAAERIRLEICGAPVVFEGTEIPVSASFGMAYGAPQSDMHMATQHADEALYRAKDTGRNKVVFYEGE